MLMFSAVMFFVLLCFVFFFFKQKTAYEMRISDWSSDVCSSDLLSRDQLVILLHVRRPGQIEFALGQATRTFFLVFAWIERLIIDCHQSPFDHGEHLGKIGRASCRERVCQYV